jgi:hypothetical protein
MSQELVAPKATTRLWEHGGKTKHYESVDRPQLMQFAESPVGGRSVSF